MTTPGDQRNKTTLNLSTDGDTVQRDLWGEDSDRAPPVPQPASAPARSKGGSSGRCKGGSGTVQGHANHPDDAGNNVFRFLCKVTTRLMTNLGTKQERNRPVLGILTWYPMLFKNYIQVGGGGHAKFGWGADFIFKLGYRSNVNNI